jgi:hypothetical protein
MKFKLNLIVFLNNGSAYKKLLYGMKRSWHSSFIIIMAQESAPFLGGTRYFSLLHRNQTKFWGPTNLLSNEYWVFLPREYEQTAKP